MEDAFQLWEVVALSKYNEWKLSEFVIEQAKRKQR
nr:MAG TPA: hypothetical protein [Caudoviricetes sp.]